MHSEAHSNKVNEVACVAKTNLISLKFRRLKKEGLETVDVNYTFHNHNWIKW